MDPTGGASTIERRMMDRARAEGTPINGSLELLPLCNLRCKMCYVRMDRAEMERKGGLRSVEEWLEVGRQMQKAGTLFLLLTGGEPLLYPGFRELYLGLKKLGFFLTINTNGTLLNEEWADFFAAHKPRRINITLYGADNAAYASLCGCPDGFDRAMNAVRLLKARGVDVNLGSTLTPQNEGDLERILQTADSLDCHIAVETYVIPAERERDAAYDLAARLSPESVAAARLQIMRHRLNDEEYARFLQNDLMIVEHSVPAEPQHGIACMAGSCSFTVNWQGMMRPCVVFSAPSESVFELGFDEAWRRIREHCSAVRLNPKCAGCRLRPICRTCAASALLETGSYDGIPDYVCRCAEETHRLLRREAERLNLWQDR